MTDYADAPSRRELAIETRERYEPDARRSTSRYSGLRVDEYGYDRDGRWYPEYDGGGQW